MRDWIVGTVLLLVGGLGMYYRLKDRNSLWAKIVAFFSPSNIYLLTPALILFLSGLLILVLLMVEHVRNFLG